MMHSARSIVLMTTQLILFGTGTPILPGADGASAFISCNGHAGFDKDLPGLKSIMVADLSPCLVYFC